MIPRYTRVANLYIQNLRVVSLGVEMLVEYRVILYLS